MRLAVVLVSCLLPACLSATAWSQRYNAVTAGGGYAFAKIEDSDAGVTGWRANILYEMRRAGSPWAHGASLGFAGLKTSVTTQANQQTVTSDYTIASLPVYYAPKYMVGGEDFTVFVKGALGVQFSWLTRTGTVAELSDNDFGFYGGLGGGLMYMIDDDWFVNAEYDWAYMVNSFYRDGFLNSIMAGVGLRF